ncbi:MAG: carboxylesterase family protein [Hymenobacter sp.]|nr:MAG: carboxylesterase family protein [Hymenobacter sp.]
MGAASAARAQAPPDSLAYARVRVAGGRLAGVALAGGVRVFRGIPYAAPPVGTRRWQPPQPAAAWAGVRPATEFGPYAPQQVPFYAQPRATRMSEDCLYLNVWTGAAAGQARRPVYIFIHGGAFLTGDGSDALYDGESMARQGVVYVTLNYRLGALGFLAHPELTRESPHHASGNYGLLDQAAAIAWVRANIAAFGGDPQRITIGGESAGSHAVSLHLASPLTRGLLAGAVAESGALLDLQHASNQPLAAAEQTGVALARRAKAPTLAALRAMPAQQVLRAGRRLGGKAFLPIVDGYFLPQSPLDILAAGQQAQVPLLAGWNAAEVPALLLLGLRRPTPRGFRAAVRRRYGARAEEVLRAYPAATRAEARQAALDLANDRTIGFGTWKLADLQVQTSARPVYRYLYAHPSPPLTKQFRRAGGLKTRLLKYAFDKLNTGQARHGAEIVYALGNLAASPIYTWQAADYAVAQRVQGYWVNFLKTGSPNGVDAAGAPLPAWPALRPGSGGQLLRLEATPRVETDHTRPRYLLLQQIGYPQ